MMKLIALSTALIATACSQPSPEPTPDGPNAEATTVPPPRTASSKPTLTATRSSLSANVSDLRVRVSETSTIVDLPSDVLFAFGSAELGSGARSQLVRVVPLIERGEPGRIEVVGHTDAVGDDASNLTLSERRAAAVVTWLKGQDVTRARDYAATGRGEIEPIAPNVGVDGQDDPGGRARNRRVEIVIPR